MDSEKFQELMLEQFNKIFERLDILENGLSRTESKVDMLDKGLSRTESKVDVLDKGLSRTESKVDVLEKGLSRTELKIDKLEIRVENEVIDKIRALFDDREIQNARLDSIEAKQDSVSADINYLVSRVVRLEKIAK